MLCWTTGLGSLPRWDGTAERINMQGSPPSGTLIRPGDGSPEPIVTAPQRAAAEDRSLSAFRRQDLAPYARPILWRSLLDLATSVVPYLALSVAMYLLLPVSYVLVLVLAIPTSGFLVRTFILFHDCTHGSLLPSKRANAWVGAFLGLLVYSPFLRWRHDHAIHHATSGDLDRRGAGDVRTLTVAEYQALTPRSQLAYRVFRNPLIMFGIGPIVALLIGPRMIGRDARPRMRRSVVSTNIALALLVGGLCWLIGWESFLLIQLPPIMPVARKRKAACGFCAVPPSSARIFTKLSTCCISSTACRERKRAASRSG